MNGFQTKLLTVALGTALVGPGLSWHAQAADGDKLTVLEFKYTGDTCSVWSNQQSTTASCIDYDPGTAEVRVVAFDPLDRTAVWYDGVVEMGKGFTVDALNAELFFLTGQSVVLQISDVQGMLLQEVEVGIDDPLLLQKDDIYGGITLKKVSYKFKVPKDYPANQYIVGFDDAVSWTAVEDYVDYWGIYGVEANMELPLVNALVMKVPAYVTPAELAADPGVTTVRLNKILSAGVLLNSQGDSFIRPFKDEDNEREKFEYPWSIAKLFGFPYDYDSTDAPTVMLDKDRMPDLVTLAMYAVEQTDLRIAVFDTGIEDDHDRARKVVGGINVVTPDDHGEFPEGKPGDDNGHGTHVTGILTAILDKDFELGKNARLKVYAVKVLDEYATGRLSNIIMGLQWAIDNGIDVVNMSLGYYSDDPLVRKAIQRAHDAGVILVASAGNRSNYDDSVVLQGMGEGGAGEGGAGEGGAGEGGAGEGGAGEGGAGEGGAGEGGAGEGGAGEGGAGEGGAGEGGAGEGGAGEGGAGEGGAGEGGAGEGGAGEGGAGEGGAGEGGAGEGGAGEGGAGEGGAGEGGAGEGGAGEGGAGEGGAGEGGAGEGGAGEGGAGEGGAGEGGAGEGGASGVSTESYCDNFDTEDTLDGSNCDTDWSGSPWVKNSSDIDVEHDDDSGFNSIHLEIDADAGGNTSIYREVDLSGATSAILSFDQNSDSDGQVILEVSSNGGSTWTTLESYNLGSTPAGHDSFDISSFIAANTRIRFKITDSDDDGHLYIDNVVITCQIPYMMGATSTTDDGAGEGDVGEGGAGDDSSGSLSLYAVMYPARYPEVIAVGASDRWGELTAFSNWGPELDVMAPGADIFSWDITNGNLRQGYGNTNGTSMAAPHVTGAVAMLASLDPTLSVAEIRQILRQTADYSVSAPVGELNLLAALDEVVSRLIGSDPALYDYNTLKDLYKDAIEAKLKALGF